MADSLLDNYNPLYDVHLRQYFALPHMQRHLRNIGLLQNEEAGRTNGDSEMYARHHAMMDMMLRNREAQLAKLADLQKKLDAAEKVEICRRIRNLACLQSGVTSPESLRRAKPSRSLSRGRPGGSGRQRRSSTSTDDKDLIKKIESENDESPPENPSLVYNRLSANVGKYRYLHKLDDETLSSYMEQLRKQLNRLERFREVSFGPHSVARHQGEPQQSWFFRRRSTSSKRRPTRSTSRKRDEPVRVHKTMQKENENGTLPALYVAGLSKAPMAAKSPHAAKQPRRARQRPSQRRDEAKPGIPAMQNGKLDGPIVSVNRDMSVPETFLRSANMPLSNDLAMTDAVETATNEPAGMIEAEVNGEQQEFEENNESQQNGAVADEEEHGEEHENEVLRASESENFKEQQEVEQSFQVYQVNHEEAEEDEEHERHKRSISDYEPEMLDVHPDEMEQETEKTEEKTEKDFEESARNGGSQMDIEQHETTAVPQDETLSETRDDDSKPDEEAAPTEQDEVEEQEAEQEIVEEPAQVLEIKPTFQEGDIPKDVSAEVMQISDEISNKEGEAEAEHAESIKEAVTETEPIEAHFISELRTAVEERTAESEALPRENGAETEPALEETEIPSGGEKTLGEAERLSENVEVSKEIGRESEKEEKAPEGTEKAATEGDKVQAESEHESENEPETVVEKAESPVSEIDQRSSEADVADEAVEFKQHESVLEELAAELQKADEEAPSVQINHEEQLLNGYAEEHEEVVETAKDEPTEDLLSEHEHIEQTYLLQEEATGQQLPEEDFRDNSSVVENQHGHDVSESESAQEQGKDSPEILVGNVGSEGHEEVLGIEEIRGVESHDASAHEVEEEDHNAVTANRSENETPKNERQMSEVEEMEEKQTEEEHDEEAEVEMKAHFEETHNDSVEAAEKEVEAANEDDHDKEVKEETHSDTQLVDFGDGEGVEEPIETRHESLLERKEEVAATDEAEDEQQIEEPKDNNDGETGAAEETGNKESASAFEEEMSEQQIANVEEEPDEHQRSTSAEGEHEQQAEVADNEEEVRCAAPDEDADYQQPTAAESSKDEGELDGKVEDNEVMSEGDKDEHEAQSPGSTDHQSDMELTTEREEEQTNGVENEHGEGGQEERLSERSDEEERQVESRIATAHEAHEESAEDTRYFSETTHTETTYHVQSNGEYSERVETWGTKDREAEDEEENASDDQHKEAEMHKEDRGEQRVEEHVAESEEPGHSHDEHTEEIVDEKNENLNASVNSSEVVEEHETLRESTLETHAEHADEHHDQGDAADEDENANRSISAKHNGGTPDMESLENIAHKTEDDDDDELHTLERSPSPLQMPKNTPRAPSDDERSDRDNEEEASERSEEASRRYSDVVEESKI